MAFNIPSNPIENPAAGLTATAVSPALAGAAAAGPYQIASAAAEGALKVTAEIQKGQKLDDEAVVMKTLSEADTLMRDIRTAQNESPATKNAKGEDVKYSDFTDPNNVAAGTFGRNEFNAKVKDWADQRFATLTSSQRRAARVGLIDLQQKHTNALGEDQASKRKEIRAATGVESVQTIVANGDWSGAVSRNRQQFENGAYGQDTYQAVRQYVANEEFRSVVTDFMSKPANDTNAADTIRQIDEWKNPLITEEMKASAVGSVYTYQEKARVDQVRNLGLAQDANEVQLIGGITKGQVTSEMVISAAQSNVISRDSVGTLLTMLKDTSEGKTTPGVLVDLSLATTKAQDLSQTAQLEAKARLKAIVYSARETGHLSNTDFSNQLALVNKLGSGDWQTAGYKEAVARAGLLLGAAPPTIGADGTPDIAAMMSQMMAGNQKTGAQLVRLKIDLDRALVDVPADEVSQKALDWVYENAPRYAPSAPTVADLTSAVRARVSPFIDASGALTKPKQDVFDSLHADFAAGRVTQEEYEVRFNEMSAWFEAREAAAETAKVAAEMAAQQKERQ